LRDTELLSCAALPHLLPEPLQCLGPAFSRNLLECRVLMLCRSIGLPSRLQKTQVEISSLPCASHCSRRYADIDWNMLPAGASAKIHELLRRCLARDRNERLSSIGEARTAIRERLSDPAGGSPLDVGFLKSRLQPRQRRALRAALFLSAVMMLLTAAGFLFWKYRNAYTPETSANLLNPGNRQSLIAVLPFVNISSDREQQYSGYAKAWAALAAAQALQASFGYVPVEEGYPQALASVHRALELDDRTASVHVMSLTSGKAGGLKTVNRSKRSL
jgi:hypothetical protein